METDQQRTARFKIGQVVQHRIFDFRGVIFDIDPVFHNTEEWWLACLLYTSPSPRDRQKSRMPSSA